MLYFLPEISNTEDYKTVVTMDDVQLVEETLGLHNAQLSCSPEFISLAEIIMRESGLMMPTNNGLETKISFDFQYFNLNELVILGRTRNFSLRISNLKIFAKPFCSTTTATANSYQEHAIIKKNKLMSETG